MPLIYIDESGFQSESTRTHSYSLQGTRAEGEFNWQLKNCGNAIGAIIENRLLTVGVFNCSVNTEVFECWIEQDLLPKLKESSVLIMDKCDLSQREKTSGVDTLCRPLHCVAS